MELDSTKAIGTSYQNPHVGFSQPKNEQLSPTPSPSSSGEQSNFITSSLKILEKGSTYLQQKVMGGVEYLHGLTDGLSPLTPFSDLLIDSLGLKTPHENPSLYWKGRRDGSNLGMAIDTLFMGGGTALSGASIGCAVTTTGLCIPVAGPGFAAGAATTLVGGILMVGHGANYERAEAEAKRNATSKTGKSEKQFSDPKYAIQLQKQFAKDGPKSIKKTLGSIEQRLKEHKEKLGSLKYQSSVEREIRTFEKQVETLQQFMVEKGIK